MTLKIGIYKMTLGKMTLPNKNVLNDIYKITLGKMTFTR